MKLTKAAVMALKTDKEDHVYWDDSMPGFGVRVRGGAKRWIIQYRVGRQQRRESLGDIRKVTLDDARSVARKRFASVVLGADPAADKAKARAAAAATKLTLGSVAGRYLDARRDLIRPNTFKEATRYFAVQWRPLSDRQINGIARADVAAQLQVITKENGRIAASRARAYLSAMFAWAICEGLCEANPVIATNDPGAGVKPRERVLADHELATIWNACGDDDFGRIVRLLILTGCRRQEIGRLKWAEINFDTGVITIPADRTKNHHALELSLPAVALEILQSTPHRGEYFFGNGPSGFTSWSMATVALRHRITAPLAPWSLHDLRRTYRTGLGRLGVRPDISELLINHVKGGVQAIYDRYSYSREKKAALALWAEHVASLVEEREPKVLAFPASY
jgi:integrase